jgi:hypothetical protein
MQKYFQFIKIFQKNRISKNPVFPKNIRERQGNTGYSLCFWDVRDYKNQAKANLKESPMREKNWMY